MSRVSRRKVPHSKIKDNVNITFSISDNVSTLMLEKGYVSAEVTPNRTRGVKKEVSNFFLKDTVGGSRLSSLVRKSHSIKVGSVHHLKVDRFRHRTRKYVKTTSSQTDKHKYEILVKTTTKSKIIHVLEDIHAEMQYLGDVTIGEKEYSKYTANFDSSIGITALLAGDGGAADE